MPMLAQPSGALLCLGVMLGTSLFVVPEDSQAEVPGEISVNARLRFETAQIDGFEDADNASARLRLGYSTPDYHGVQATVVGEFTGVADEADYNAAGVHGNPAKAVIADPRNSELDQAFLSYAHPAATVAVGRQVITLDNHRFVGDVGWRQNHQTYDAATLRSAQVEDLTLFYGFVDNVIRIFGSEAPRAGVNAREAESASHLVNASYRAADTLTLTAYGYLLDLDNVPATFSSDSYGASATGRLPLGGLTAGYRVEYARQQDAGDNPLDYQADYYDLALDGTYHGLTLQAGYEVLGSDPTGQVDADGAPVFASFQTPLATLHKFNGFADRFLITPDTGLEDRSILVGYTASIPGKVGPVTGKICYHEFRADEGSADLGDEWDVLLIKPITLEAIPGTITAVGKYADFRAGEVGADTQRFTAELSYSATF